MSDPRQVLTDADAELQQARALVREGQRIILKRLRDKRRAQGLCMDCGKTSETHRTCLACRRKRSARRRLRKTA